MCGGDLDVSQKDSIAICPYCDTKQTLPRLDDDRRANLYDRANHFRRNNEYDKAAGLYEAILSEDPTDAEAYWSLVLCRYGVEYVEDPRGKGRIPTCNRTLYASVTVDADYLSALEHADSNQKTIYEQEAKTLDSIQRSILEVSAKEEPFDIFICYKQSDTAGNRTSDSVLAQDIYTGLFEAGYRVFFAGITLEPLLGSEYEAHIFAALQSAKAMVVVGTNKDNLDAVWVKNEWSRYLALIKEGAKKTLIVAYGDMSPYDLPEALAPLQAQDMGKIGAMQDLLRGMKKVIGDTTSAQASLSADPNAVAPGAESLYQRALIYLEDKDFDRAGIYFDKALDVNPKYAPAYVGLLMVELKITQEEDLTTRSAPLAGSNNYDKALRFADEGLKAKLEGVNQAILDRLEAERRAQEETQREVQRKAEEAARRQQEETERKWRKIKQLEDELNDASAGSGGAAYAVGIQNQSTALKQEMTQLVEERKTLGVFALEEKRQINARLDALRYQEAELLGPRSHSLKSAQCRWHALTLDEEQGLALLLTEDCVAQMPYHAYQEAPTWEACSLRHWLNTEFLAALPAEIQSRIHATQLVNSGNKDFGVADSRMTTDKVFCLSADEARQYLPKAESRIATYLGEKVSWWLRSPGEYQNLTAIVAMYGIVFSSGVASNGSKYTAGVRPAMWVKID